MSFYVEIVETGKGVVKRMGPMSEWRATKVEAGADRNLDRENYFTRIVKGNIPDGEKGPGIPPGKV